MSLVTNINNGLKTLFNANVTYLRVLYSIYAFLLMGNSMDNHNMATLSMLGA